MYDVTESIVAQAIDPKIAFIAATVFGYCLYRIMRMTKGRSHQFSEDSDEMDNNVVKISIHFVFNYLTKIHSITNNIYNCVFFLYKGIYRQVR